MIKNNKNLETKKENFNRLEFIRQISEKYGKSIEEIIELFLNAQTTLKPITEVVKMSNREYQVSRTGIGILNTKYGKFYQITFNLDDKWKNYMVIGKCSINEKDMLPAFNKEKEIYLRIDSGCSTGQIFGDLTCECKPQLEYALKTIGMNEQGLIICIPSQDGRGKGTEFKLASLYLQEKIGLDTTESFMLLEKDNSSESLDCRDYNGAIAILKFMKIKSKIILGTNNPEKINSLKKEGFKIESSPVFIPPTSMTTKHLKAKKEVLGHKLI